MRTRQEELNLKIEDFGVRHELKKAVQIVGSPLP